MTERRISTLKILYKVEIHKVKASDLTFLNGDQFVDDVDAKINNIMGNNKEKTLDEIVQEICEQTNIDKQVMADVKDIVSFVQKSVKFHRNTLRRNKAYCMLFTLCKAVEKAGAFLFFLSRVSLFRLEQERYSLALWPCLLHIRKH